MNFEYLRAAGAVPLNPASTKLVSPPGWPSELVGRALSAKEVLYLLSGPDRGKPEGARRYALMLVMLRLSLRVSEVCSLRASSVKWSHGRWTLRCKVKGAGKRHGRCRTYRQVQMMSKHKEPKTVMRCDHGRENLKQNAVNFLRYDEEA